MKKPWPTKKLGEVAIIYGGGKSGITKKDYIESGLPAFSATGQDGFIKKAFDSGNAIILSSIGARCGKCFYAEGKWTALANTQIIKFNKPITAKFLYYYLNDERKWPRFGSAQPFIAPSTVQRLEIPIPSLKTQQKIVNRLDAIKKAQELNDKQIKLTEELFQSLLSTELNPEGKNWRVKKLKDIIVINYGKGLPKEDRKRDGQYWAYGSNGPVYKTNKILVKFSTIIVGRKGTAGALYLVEEPSWPIDTTFYIEIKNKNEIDLNFLYFLLHTMNLQYLAIITAVPGVNRDNLYNLKIPLPAFKIQQKIAEKFSALQNYKKKLLEQKQKLQELSESVLDRSFKGQLVG